MGDADAPHHVIAYEDPQCPVCNEFEKTSGAVLAKAVADGKVSVEYRMMNFLGPESVRAVAALGAAANQGKFAELRAALFAHQPKERTGGFTVDDLIRLGAGVGLTDAAYTAAVTKQTYAAWARRSTSRRRRTASPAHRRSSSTARRWTQRCSSTRLHSAGRWVSAEWHLTA